jgi:hypothetical protein
MLTQTTIRPANRDRRYADPPGRRGSRPWSALIALASAAFVAIIASPLFGSFFAIGIPAATVLGALLGPSVRANQSVDGPVIAMATLSIPLAEIVFILSTPSATTRVESVLFVVTYGLMYVGIPMLIVTVPCAIGWAMAVRGLSRRGEFADVPVIELLS